MLRPISKATLLFTLTMVLAMLGSQNRAMADGGGGGRLRAHATKVIHGIRAELQGEFRRNGNADNNHGKELRGELNNINLRRGTVISFCLATENGVLPLAAVRLGNADGGEKNAEFDLSTQNGDSVPNVIVNDRLEAHNGGTAGNPDCSAPLLLDAGFHRGN